MGDALVDQQKFFDKHPDSPELSQYFSEFLGTYRSCQPGSAEGYEEMYSHIFGSPRENGCQWCQNHFDWRVKYAQSFTRAS